MSSSPLAIDLFCGLGGWTDGLLAEGYDVVGFDIEQHVYGEHRYPAQLVLQDVTTLHGSQFRKAALIIASPPCQGYSYRAMPWKRAKALPPPDNTLFETCFRIQREACEAAGRHIPLIVENVRGAQKWVGRARWNYGSFYLWGDVPALMPHTFRYGSGPGNKRPGRTMCFPAGSANPDAVKGRSGKLHWQDEGTKQRGSGREWWDKALDERRKEATAIKNAGHLNQRDGHTHTRHITNPAEHDGIKQPGIDLSDIGFNVANAREFGHMVVGVKIKRSEDDKRQHIGTSRKFASAMIAKIPLPLSRHIAATFARSVQSRAA